MYKYSRDTLLQLNDVVHTWQHGGTLTSHESAQFSALVYNVSNDRWNKHFGNRTRDWTDTKLMREEVPLVFMQYLKMRKSVRLAGRKCCPLDTPVYPSLMYTLCEFRRQFPRVISVLTANHVGVTLLHEYQPRNVCYMVRLPIYTELHRALCIMRKIAREQGNELYGAQRHTLRREVFNALYLDHRVPTAKEIRDGNRVAQRRLLVVNAASDILASRVLAHHDACHNQPKSSYLYHLTQNNTNEETYV